MLRSLENGEQEDTKSDRDRFGVKIVRLGDGLVLSDMAVRAVSREARTNLRLCSSEYAEEVRNDFEQ